MAKFKEWFALISMMMNVQFILSGEVEKNTMLERMDSVEAMLELHGLQMEQIKTNMKGFKEKVDRSEIKDRDILGYLGKLGRKVAELGISVSSFSPIKSASSEPNKVEREMSSKSCKDLNQIGHSLNGIYLVNGAGRNPNKILAVYCNLNDPQNSETLIGTVDVKSTSVHFYVQRQSELGANTIVSFDVERLNIGGAMNLATGIFTTPVTGIYHFGFSCQKHSDIPYTDIHLQLNGVNVGLASSHVKEGRAFLSISLHASLELKKGDRVNIYKEYGLFRGSRGGSENPPYTHFSGWLLEENLSLLTVA